MSQEESIFLKNHVGKLIKEAGVCEGFVEECKKLGLSDATIFELYKTAHYVVTGEKYGS